jgi:hypothetical protein
VGCGVFRRLRECGVGDVLDALDALEAVDLRFNVGEAGMAGNVRTFYIDQKKVN